MLINNSLSSKKSLAIIVVVSIIVIAIYVYRVSTTQFNVSTSSSSRRWTTTCAYANGSHGSLKLVLYVANKDDLRYEGYRGKDRIDFQNENASGIVFIWPEGAPRTVIITMAEVKFPLKLIHVSRNKVVDIILLEPQQVVIVDMHTPLDFLIELDPSIEIGDTIELKNCG